MIKLQTILTIITSILLLACNNSSIKETDDLIRANIEVIEQENEYNLRYFNLLNAEGHRTLNDNAYHLLNIKSSDSISTDKLDAIISRFDDEFYITEINTLNKSKDDYNNSILSKDSLTSRNYLAIFKNHLIHFIYQMFDYCGPDPRFQKIKTFSQVITKNPTKNKEVEILLSLGAFDSSYVYNIYIGGYDDSLGLDASQVTDTLITKNGFGKYVYTPKESGLQIIKGVMELKTKHGPKFQAFETEVYIRE